MKLPWLGDISGNYLEWAPQNATEKAFFATKLRRIFSIRTILPPTPKDSLLAFSSSCVVYGFKCECGSRYAGRTTQSLSERIKQHVPSAIRNKTVSLKQQPKRQCTSAQTINCDSAIGRHLLSNICRPAQSLGGVQVKIEIWSPLYKKYFGRYCA